MGGYGQDPRGAGGHYRPDAAAPGAPAAAAVYEALVDAAEEQRRRLLAARGVREPADRWAASARFARRPDDHDPEAIALRPHVQSGDVVVDVGGGYGRLSLPLARWCTRVLNVEPSPAMASACEAFAKEAGVAVDVLPRRWEAAAGVEGDVVVAAHSISGVRDVVPFLTGLAAAARRLVAVVLYATAPEAQPTNRRVFEAVFGETPRIGPGFRDLLPVMWDMGLVPDVTVVHPASPRRGLPTPRAAVETAVRQLGALVGCPIEDADAYERVDAHFDSLFCETPDGFVPKEPSDPRRVVITWRTSGSGPPI